MSSQRHKRAALAAGLVLLTACTDVKAKADDSAPADAADYVLHAYA